ncbi:cell division protein ZapB [Vibrio parahaemolyticus]|nr:cell division protein ZapB [Vibrio parahaemolyticus]ELV8620907.1 hypothetical protein [Vibrio vulnificus]EHH1049897.1 hypothetical protein [Vibrio parahaemolyticus]ELV8737781.1 hypothetical protein [Vibrio vulnificus]MBE4452296.1 hypothetical protein [Vibrio parahaemolyticus]HCG7758129.1 hypothetical protein [Vibrio parahaemolyticus]
MPKGALKGENRFKASQKAGINGRVQRLKEVVVPKMKALCESVHFPNKTAFQKMCAEVFNENLPVNMKCITHRTLATNSAYWVIVGSVYHRYYNSDDSKSLNALRKEALDKLDTKEKIEELEQKNKQLTQENGALKRYIATSKYENKAPVDETDVTYDDINNLIATIDFLVKATEGIVFVDKEKRTITNLALDIHGVLSKSISCTYFDILEGKS